MKTKVKLEENIINIITKIHGQFPELSKYITEMPLNESDNAEVMVKNLEDYYQSLEELVDKYASTHPEAIDLQDDNSGDLDIP